MLQHLTFQYHALVRCISTSFLKYESRFKHIVQSLFNISGKIHRILLFWRYCWTFTTLKWWISYNHWFVPPDISMFYIFMFFAKGSRVKQYVKHILRRRVYFLVLFMAPVQPLISIMWMCVLANFMTTMNRVYILLRFSRDFLKLT